MHAYNIQAAVREDIDVCSFCCTGRPPKLNGTEVIGPPRGQDQINRIIRSKNSTVTVQHVSRHIYRTLLFESKRYTLAMSWMTIVYLLKLILVKLSRIRSKEQNATHRWDWYRAVYWATLRDIAKSPDLIGHLDRRYSRGRLEKR